MNRRPNAPVNRRNWKDTREYLDYCANVRQCSTKTCEVYRCNLDRFLEWATSIPFPKCPALRPTFPQYLCGTGLSIAYCTKALAVSRAFFQWAVENHNERYADVKPIFINSLILRKRDSEVKERAAYTVDEVMQLVETPATSLVERRDRAAVAFLFLSGMRNSAFCSLPIRAVDFEEYPPRVKQWPKLGVRTKFGKAATTMLLVEPAPILKICREWDAYVREIMPKTAPWFPLIDGDTETFSQNQTPGEHRSFTPRLRLLCKRAGVEFKSPHKLRNAHIVYALKQCRDMADLKAVSQNVMHESIKTTEAVYAKLREDDIATRLANLGGTRGTDIFQSNVVPATESNHYPVG